MLKEGELERAVELAARHLDADGCILILLDADADCPKELAESLLRRARGKRPDRRIHVVLAKREFESWFLAAAASLAGRRGLSEDTTSPAEPETIQDAKRWLSERMPAGRSYRATLDRPAFSAVLDVEAARRAPSFDKLWRDVVACLG